MNKGKNAALGAYRRENIVWPARAQRIISKTHIEEYAAERIFVPKGRRLVVEGAETSSVYLQLTGWTSLECVGEHGERVLIDFLISGDFIGLEIEDTAAPFTVTALTDVAVLRIERCRLRELIDDDRHFREAYVRALQSLSSRSRRHRLAVSCKSAAGRICRVLLDLAERVDGPVDEVANGRFSRIPISQVLLACAVDLTPVAVNRIVQSLRRERVLEWDISGVVVLASDRLREMA